MPRKKTDVQDAATATEQPTETTTSPSEQAAETQPTQNGERKKPAASWRYPAAAGVTVEVALWPHTIRLSSGDEIEVFNTTITRCYKDSQGTWQRGGSFRTSEIPVLVHALLKAHNFALDSREMNTPF